MRASTHLGFRNILKSFLYIVKDIRREGLTFEYLMICWYCNFTGKFQELMQRSHGPITGNQRQKGSTKSTGRENGVENDGASFRTDGHINKGKRRRSEARGWRFQGKVKPNPTVSRSSQSPRLSGSGWDICEC